MVGLGLIFSVTVMDQESNSGIVVTTIEKEVKQSYLDYAMSVIVGRALPDVRDGLKPVHRRILYTMHEMRNDWNKPYKKSARVVGDVIGKYHPHGDSSIYDAVVRMAQDFSMRQMLIDGHGNFGSVDGDAAAAMRYTEVRMAKITHEMVADLEKEVVDFCPNYDGSEHMPTVLPTKFPNLLVNGSSGIAVGMATNIPPHNLGEVIDACLLLIEQPDCQDAEVFAKVPGPDFPTAGIINGKSGIIEAYKTGRGKLYIRGRAAIEMKKDKPVIVIDELPYAVNKARLVEKIGQLVRDKKLEGITALRDESNRKGMRVVIECRRNENAEVLLNQLYIQTQLQVVYGINMVSLIDGKPVCMGLRKICEAFIKHRQDVVRRRFEFDIKKARAKAHILEGLAVCIGDLDEVIALIRAARTSQEAKQALLERRWSLEGFPLAEDERAMLRMEQFGDYGSSAEWDGYKLSEAQAQAVLDLRLHKLTGLERDKVVADLRELVASIASMLEILGNYSLFMGVIRDELEDVKTRFATPRRTLILDSHEDLDDLDLIPDDQLVVTLSHMSYMKAQSIDEYRVQGRGGKGKMSAVMKSDDVIARLCIATRHQDLLCFTNLGRVYQLPVRHLPLHGRSAKGRPANNFMPLQDGECIETMLPMGKQTEQMYCVMATQLGMIKKVQLKSFQNVRSSGIIAINMREGDRLIGAALVEQAQDVMLFSDIGKAVRFSIDEVRETGRTSQGVIGIRLKEGHKVIAMVPCQDEQATVLMATEKGYGKRTRVGEFRRSGRGVQGVIAIQSTERNGAVVSVTQVKEEDDFFLITTQGTIIRMSVASVSIIGRNTQGVRLMQISDGSTQEQVASCQVLEVL